MKQKILLLFIFILTTCPFFAQKEANNWFFGNNQGMSFSTTQTLNNITTIRNGVIQTNQTMNAIPTYITGPINTWEGCFSISDKDGNFLFASDGISVYGRDLALMTHGSGLKGHPSASQSGIVIPRPDHPSRYYIITVPAAEGARNAIHYYEVDMLARGGLGDVLEPYSGSTPIGTALNFNGIYNTTNTYENVTAVGHSNGRHFWLVHRCRQYFFVWLVTEDGINSTPTYQFDAGIDLGASIGYGYAKFSADGKYIAHASRSGERLTIAEFDNSTGTISNIKTAIYNYLHLNITMYDVEFSPNNKYLFVSYVPTGYLIRLLVNDHMQDVSQTPVILRNMDVTNIQMGPDNRIYGRGNSATISGSINYRDLFIINEPNNDEPNLAIVPNYFLAGRTSQYVVSLPTFTSSFFGTLNLENDPLYPCVNENVTFSIKINNGTGENAITRFEWEFGDGSPIKTETDMNQVIFSQNHTYKKRGTYKVILTPYKADNTIVQDKIQTVDVKVSSCRLPVNHNISVMGYYD